MNKRGFLPVHPGHILLEDFLVPMEITPCRLAESIGVPLNRIDEICAGTRAITADIALRPARFFGTDALSWMNLQAEYDLETAEITLGERIKCEVNPLKETTGTSPFPFLCLVISRTCCGASWGTPPSKSTNSSQINGSKQKKRRDDTAI